MTAESPESRVRMALGVVWLLTALLTARQAAAVLRLPPGERLTELETWIGPHGVLRMPGPLYENGTFTGTPFAGLVLKPLTRSAEQSLGVFWTFGTLLLVVALGFAVARGLPRPVSGRTRLFAAPVAISLMVLSLPVRNTFTLGQTSILPVLLVLLALLPQVSARRSGTLIGLAAALQPTALLFVPLLWLTGRRRAAATAAGTFGASSAFAWALLPHDSATYWVHHLAGAGLGGPANSLHNQSLHGLLLRWGLSGVTEVAVFAVLAVAVAVIGLRRAAHYANDGQLLLAAALTGCVAVAVSPTAWLHQQLWILLAVVGRAGRRQTDRMVWPTVVVLVMTLSSTALVPRIDGVRVIGENAPLLAALAAACAVPFLSRKSPWWDRAVPAEFPDPAPSSAPRRWIPLLGFWRRPLSRPNLLLELLLIRVGYWAYSAVRLPAAGARGNAEEHGRQILRLERMLLMDVEYAFNHAVVKVPWLESAMNFAYTSFHFLVPLVLLGWLYRRRPAMYRWARTTLSLTTLLALIGFWLYPLAPPRLMPGLGFIDTVNGPQDLDSPEFGALTKISNQYAAMPSLHVGWALWCAIALALIAPWMWLRIAGFLYPLLTVVVIVGTANHYLLDAVGGAAVVAAGFGLQYVLLGGRPQRDPDRPAPRRAAEAPDQDPLPVPGLGAMSRVFGATDARRS
ncbi:bifunctional glycosyltransferase 87/phosphatase PAP2 family protein [Streptomyces sp. KR80]|uniref:bifunctional glycosyltransferase 87/phosphatase PAP2 family protein n=1 Tax=Streptomyces sp. KR80 TaxID=3457426 RepID=UPI003FCEFC84